jgi:ubiquinone biosynthesis monooxygenase Coq7
MSCAANDVTTRTAGRTAHRGAVRATKMLKLNHLGEHIAINIYRAQVRVCRFTAPQLLPMLKDFLTHETRHLTIFAAELADRGAPRCKAFALLGCGGFLLGFFTALLGKTGVMACTAAVEAVVLDHLQHQLEYLRDARDARAVNAIEAILKDEIEHHDAGAQGKGGLLYACTYAIVAPPTGWIIKLGMYL